MIPTLSTPALVLHTTAYSETSVIAKIFTRQLGVRSYILKGVRKGGSRTKQNLLQPLSYLDLVVYNNPKTPINYLKEIAPHRGIPQSLATARADEMSRHALRFFMTELLYKTLREEEPMPDLFDYVVDTLQPQTSVSPAQLPITFMLSLARHTGIEPFDNYSPREPLFDLLSGRFQSAGAHTLDSPTSLLLHHYLLSVNSGTPAPTAPLAQRTELINRLLEYFQMHLADFRNFQSHEILHSVLQ